MRNFLALASLFMLCSRLGQCQTGGKRDGGRAGEGGAGGEAAEVVWLVVAGEADDVRPARARLANMMELGPARVAARRDGKSSPTLFLRPPFLEEVVSDSVETVSPATLRTSIGRSEKAATDRRRRGPEKRIFVSQGRGANVRRHDQEDQVRGEGPAADLTASAGARKAFRSRIFRSTVTPKLGESKLQQAR